MTCEVVKFDNDVAAAAVVAGAMVLLLLLLLYSLPSMPLSLRLPPAPAGHVVVILAAAATLKRLKYLFF